MFKIRNNLETVPKEQCGMECPFRRLGLESVDVDLNQM